MLSSQFSGTYYAVIIFNSYYVVTDIDVQQWIDEQTMLLKRHKEKSKKVL